MLKPVSIEGYQKPSKAFDPGAAPSLQWIEIKLLVIDQSYQREIGRRGNENIKHIAENFEWSKFAPIIVAPVEGGLYAIVDGQHRTTAAMLRGIERVPAQVVHIDAAKQAETFAAVNGNVTKTTAQQLYFARLAARDPETSAMAEVCAAAGVEISRRTNLVMKKMKVGQTIAVESLRRCLRDYGRDTLITALQCITQTGDGNPGCVRATIIEALCAVLHRNPAWREAGEALLRAMDDFDFIEAWDSSMEGQREWFTKVGRAAIERAVADHLEKRLKTLVQERTSLAMSPSTIRAGQLAVLKRGSLAH